MANVNRIKYDKWTFTDHEIVSGNMNKEKSLLASNLSIDTLDFTVWCADASIINFAQNAPVMYFYGEQQKGTFYLRTIERIGKNRYKINAVSAVVLLAQKQHKGGIYTGQKAENVIFDICGEIPVIVKTIFRDIELFGWLPYATARENLAHVLFALGASLGIDINGTLRVEALWDVPASAILPNKMYTGGNIKYSNPVTSVTVIEHKYSEGTEAAKLFEGETQEGDIIKFSEPMHSLVAEGFTILNSGANYAKVSSGNGTLTGKKYVHNTRAVRRDIAFAEPKNDIVIENETLVSMTKSGVVTKWVADYYKCVETIENPIIAEEEQPGHVVTVYHPYEDKMVNACISALDSSMSSFLKSNMNAIVGFTPPKHVSTSMSFESETIITEDGDFIVPDGITQIMAVLIGGGNGGEMGADGEITMAQAIDEDGWSGVILPNESTAFSITRTSTSFTGTQGGNGGNGGAGGSCGKIFEITLNVTPGDKIPITIGKGGRLNGGIGGDTTFGEYSSAHGETPINGYTDPLTFAQYCINGINGERGGNGGVRGMPGENRGTAKGGKGCASTQGSQDGADSPWADPNPPYGFTVTYDASFMATEMGGGGAGGMSGDTQGSNGENASPGIFSVGPGDLIESEKTASLIVFRGGYGGDGADGANGVIMGSGGAGGGGGGGAGSIYDSSITLNISAINNSSRGKGANYKVTNIGNYDSHMKIKGGSGGSGGAGANGGVIVFFGTPGENTSGQFVTRDNKMLLGNNNRRFVM